MRKGLECLEGSGRGLLANGWSAHFIFARMPPTQRYSIYIQGNTLAEATEEALHLAYWLLTRALQEHRRQGRNGDYEAFAIQLLALLQSSQHLYTTENEVSESGSEE